MAQSATLFIKFNLEMIIWKSEAVEGSESTSPGHYIYLNLFSKNPSQAGANFINLLPGELKKTPHQHLKRQLTSWLLEIPFYSVEKYLKKNYEVLLQVSLVITPTLLLTYCIFYLDSINYL